MAAKVVASLDPVPVAAQRPLVQFQRADQIQPKPTDWLVEGWLPKDSLVGLVGASGTCKSFLALDWSCRVATGSSWLESKVARGQVYYLAGEGRAGIRKRIAAWEQFTGTPINDAPLYIADSLPGLLDPFNAAAVVQAITDVADADFFQTGDDPSLIVIDTVARAMAGGNEDSAGDMGKLISSLDWLRQTWNATVMVVHHTGHGEAERARGSSAFRAALDAEYLTKADGNTVILRATKGKDWRLPDPIALKRVQVELQGQWNDVEREMERPETSLVLADTLDGGTEAQRKVQVYRLHDEGKTFQQIADLTRIPKTTVYRWIKG